MATLLKKKVQSISAEECSMADPVQTARQLQWNSQEHLPKLCRDVVGYNGWFDRSLLSRTVNKNEWIELYHCGQRSDFK